jgi:hypothetical protein
LARGPIVRPPADVPAFPLVTLRCTASEVALILHALRAVPPERDAAAQRLADMLAAEVALGERRRPRR